MEIQTSRSEPQEMKASCPKIGVWAYKSCNTDELKYSIRSAIKNLGLEKIIIIGDKPLWLQESERVIFIPFSPVKDANWTRAYVAWQYLDKLLSTRLVEGDFLYFNDDFFILRPITKWVDYQRDLKDYNERVKTHNTLYHMRDLRALRLLKTSEECHFNLHIPICLNTRKLVPVINFWKQSAVKDFEFRTYYGNVYLKDAPSMIDVKHRPNGTFFSSGDDRWKVCRQTYCRMFPDKSYAERHN